MTLSGWEAVFFWVFAIAAIFAGLLTVMARNTVHSALFLISSLISVAALFILLGAEFIAGVQILVYVGGVMVLFLFVIMLVNVGLEERESAPIFNRNSQVTASLIFCLLMVFGILFAVNSGARALDAKESPKKEEPVNASATDNAGLEVAATGTARLSKETEKVGSSLYRYASLPFEVASVLLLVAIIGSVMLARTIKQEASVDDVAPEVLLEEVKYEPELAEFVRADVEKVSESNA
ncbi:MAG TPA: NADH-quinone oxidoreductase subunit J [Pyrinomonadaceae bacterium]|jgi:NADH:ubiquinone oxidoreductase subunit 6 (subunit J)|nr:NADH-quinone oxidoreductase subunit J [Pyrinomonadaceae bacterium]